MEVTIILVDPVTQEGPDTLTIPIVQFLLHQHHTLA